MEKTVENVLEIFKDYIASSPFIVLTLQKSYTKSILTLLTPQETS